jgi:hypothetical protein
LKTKSTKDMPITRKDQIQSIAKEAAEHCFNVQIPKAISNNKNFVDIKYVKYGIQKSELLKEGRIFFRIIQNLCKKKGYNIEEIYCCTPDHSARITW